MRTQVVVPFEIKRLAKDAAVGSVEGYGSVFNTLDSYDDIVMPGSFKVTLAKWQARGKFPKMLLQHGGGYFAGGADDLVPVGQWEEMREDDHGLYVRGRIFDIGTDRAKATIAAAQAGELDGLSIGFRTVQSSTDDQTGIRKVTEIDLFEVSLVTFPANDPARITAVKSQGGLPTERDLEVWLRREAGLTRDQAKCVIASGYRQVLREAGSADALSTTPSGTAGGHVVEGHQRVLTAGIESLRAAMRGAPTHD